MILAFLFFIWKIGIFDIIGGGEPSPDGTYQTVSVTKLYEDIKNNKLAAEEKYKDNYFSITGQVNNIESDYIVIYEVNNTWSNRVFCRIKSDEQKKLIKTLNKGDIVTVKGKITSIGEIIGCYLNMAEIYKNN